VYCNQRLQVGYPPACTEATVHAAVADLERRGWPRGRPVVLAFYGGTFTSLPAARQTALLSAARAHLGPGRVAAVRVSTHPARIDDASLARLRHFGVRTVELGIQSLDDAVLAAAGRAVDRKACLTALRWVREAGFELGAQLMPGLPGASRGSDRETAALLATTRPDLVRIYPTVVLRGTCLADLTTTGAYTPLSLEAAVARSADQVEILEAAGCSIQRVGLHIDSALRAAWVAGPLDPAMGERVRAEVALRRLRAALRDCPPGPVWVHVPPREVSQNVGHGRRNIDALRSEFPDLSIRIVQDPSTPVKSVVVRST